MAGPNIQELLQHIDELISATRKGSISWTPVNPTTYVWERRASFDGPGAKMTLQRIEQVAHRMAAGSIAIPVRKSYVILQVHEVPLIGTPVLKLSISGSDALELNQRLEALFNLIGSGISEQGLDFFKSLIPQD